MGAEAHRACQAESTPRLIGTRVHLELGRTETRSVKATLHTPAPLGVPYGSLRLNLQ